MRSVAVIGTGYMGKVHLAALMKIPGIKIKALADTNINLAGKLGERFNIEKVTDDYRELLSDPDITVFHNCTPNHLHFGINRLILEAKKHLLSEKPLATTAEEAKILKEIANEKDVLTGINFYYRYYPVVQEFAARVRNSEIGKVHTVLGHFLQNWLLYDTDYNWRLDKKYSGASNTVADLGSHWCDLAQFVTNSKIVEVMADLRTIIPVRKKNNGVVLTFAEKVGSMEYEEVPVEVDDYGSILIHFENKASEVFTESPIIQKNSTRRYALLPSGHPMGYNDAVYNLFSDFYNAIFLKEQGVNPDFKWPDFQSGYEEMKVVETVLKSHNTKAWVKID